MVTIGRSETPRVGTVGFAQRYSYHDASPPPGKSSPCDLDISFACDEDPLPRTVRTRTNWSVPGIRARRVRQEAVGNQTNWNQGVTYTYTRATGLAPRSPR